MKKKTIC